MTAATLTLRRLLLAGLVVAVALMAAGCGDEPPTADDDAGDDWADDAHWVGEGRDDDQPPADDTSDADDDGREVVAVDSKVTVAADVADDIPEFTSADWADMDRREREAWRDPSHEALSTYYDPANACYQGTGDWFAKAREWQAQGRWMEAPKAHLVEMKIVDRVDFAGGGIVAHVTRRTDEPVRIYDADDQLIREAGKPGEMKLQMLLTHDDEHGWRVCTFAPADAEDVPWS